MRDVLQFRKFVWAACGALALTATAVAQEDRVDDDFVRSPSPAQPATPADPADPAFERRSNEPSSGLSNDWVRDESNRPVETEPVPVRREPPEEKGLERAQERANENADEGLERAVERAADEELERVERERDRPGFENRSAHAAEGDEDALDTDE